MGSLLMVLLQIS